MKLLRCLLNSPKWPLRVLGIAKLSDFDFLKTLHPDLSDNQLLDRLRKQSKDSDEILAEHRRQVACEKELARVLHNLNVGYRIIKRIDVAGASTSGWADLVIAIGGDGTFLLASKLITNNKTPIIGINPHPRTCNIFTVPVSDSGAEIERIFEKLHAGDFAVLMRSRIRTIMTGEGLYREPFHLHEKSRTQEERRIDALTRSTQRKIADALQPRRRVLPWLALNEVFMSEFVAARTITLTVEVDDEETFTVRSSGMCVCTGSGSRFWFRTMNLKTVETVRVLVTIATGRILSAKESNELLRKYHNNLLFSPEDSRMAYTIYEMYRNSRYSTRISEKRKCRRIKIKSSGFDAALVLDGSLSVPFNDGSTAVFEICPECSLKNLIFCSNKFI
ncbi:NAD kinase 2, mitochondrial-like [Pseudomyrmex gracilis]|uniref:NAD kinase 2, mitochondrial-like n=1 Tax=Pseudomyrmex gracilis TaxID=219809 RepID=UPI0009953F14|nr:NAD kinase 2, mitochondrial-like [Pseudomyrmex gracilis]